MDRRPQGRLPVPCRCPEVPAGAARPSTKAWQADCPGRRDRGRWDAARWPDEADDSYNLGWINDLPADDIRAITVLRKFLVREFDPVDRHFMYAHLEALLYRSRDAFLSALDEYDETCRLHAAEMDSIRRALVSKWGQVPVLETYRQMAIRQQKARNFEQAPG